MKKCTIFFLLLLISSFCLAQRQTEMRLKLGVGYTIIDFPEFNSLTTQQFSLNGVVGLTYDLVLNKRVRIGTEGLLYLRSLSMQDQGFILVDINRNSDYIHTKHKSHRLLGRVPFLFRYRWRGLQLSVGPSVDFNIKEWQNAEVQPDNIFEFDQFTPIPSKMRRVVMGGEVQVDYQVRFLGKQTSVGISLNRNFTDYVSYEGVEIVQPKYFDTSFYLTYLL